jgi:hypothetical protein
MIEVGVDGQSAHGYGLPGGRTLTIDPARAGFLTWGN